MGRCLGWRPQEKAHKPVHLPPGGCHRCWRPCRNRVEAGELLCGTCVDAAVTHSSAAVRSMLASSGLADVELLRRMQLDPDIGVAAAAQARLEQFEMAAVGAPAATADVVAIPDWDGADW